MNGEQRHKMTFESKVNMEELIKGIEGMKAIGLLNCTEVSIKYDKGDIHLKCKIYEDM